MIAKRRIGGDIRGVSAVEFALALPALLTFIVGIAQMGKLFFANADMRHAVAAGARVAAVWPVPEDATILAKVNEKLTRANAGGTVTTTVTRSAADADNPWVQIDMTYTLPLDFIFFSLSSVTLTETRRVYTQVEEAAEEESSTSSTSTTTTSTGGTSSDGGTTTSSTGGDASTSSTSTSSTSTGGDASTSSSWGGTTSSTSTGSTSTSSTSTSSTSTSSTSSSSGNSNGGGHGHGDCKKKC